MDKRKPYKTKTFYGACAFAVLIILQALGISLPYSELMKIVGIFTGYAVADRFRK